MNHQYNIIICLLTVVLLQACSSAGVAPVINRDEVKKTATTTTQRDTASQTRASEKPVVQNKAGYHIVNKGDTLYSIAWRYNFDYKTVASWNRINSPYTIYPGELIRLKPPLKKKGEPLNPVNSPNSTTTKQVTAVQRLPKKRPESVQKKATVVARKSTPKELLPKGPVKWFWPSKGKIVKTNSPTSQKGIDILGSSGQQVKAAAAGEVVYSGGGLIGYGKLIIIKHNETYLSAYAYNSKLLVKEGDRVNAGEAISEMGQDHAGRTVLHFEIRQNGKPVNPTKYLPKKRA